MENENEVNGITISGVIVEPPPTTVAPAGGLKAGLEALGMFKDQAPVIPTRDQDALEASNLPPVSATLMLERQLLRESSSNPRKRWGDLEELAKSMAHGQLQPLIVMPDPEKPVPEGGTPYAYVILAGARRFRAGKLAGLNEFRCEVRNNPTPEQIFEIQVVENVQRKDLHPMEEAEGYDMMKSAGYEPATIAKRVGKSPSWVHGRLKLLNLTPEARGAFYDGRIDLIVALVLGRQPQANQGKAMLALERIQSSRDQVTFLQTEFARNLKAAPFDLKDPTLPRICDPSGVGDCVSCPNNSNNSPRDLFADYQKIERAGICSDTPCYSARAAAVVDRMADRAKERGEKFLTLAETKRVIMGGTPVTGSPYVIATDVVNEDPKRRTWQQILEKLPKEERPEIVGAPDDTAPGKVLKLYDRKAAVAAAGATGAKWAKPQVPEEKQVKASKAKAEKADDRARLIATVTELAMPKLVEQLRKGVSLIDLRPLALDVLEPVGAEDVELLCAWFDVKNLEKWIRADATIKDLIAFCLVVTLWPTFQSGGESFAPAFSAITREHKIDLQAITRAQLAQSKRVPLKWKSIDGGEEAKVDGRTYQVTYNGGDYYWSKSPGKQGGSCKSLEDGRAKCELLEATASKGGAA